MYEETTVIYADILFLINFSLDFLCLFIAGRLLNCGGRLWRKLLAAILGGLYSFIPYIVSFDAFTSLLINLVFGAFICFVAFGKRDTQRFLLIFGSFMVSSALLGGLITSIYNLSSSYSDGVYREINPLSFCIICLISAMVALSYGLISRRKIHVSSAEIKIYAKNECIRVRLLADSGNLVTEPFSALPVIIVVSGALPKPYDSPESTYFPFPIRIIPYYTGTGKGCFFGFRPDKIELLIPAKKPKRIDAFIGIDTANVSYSGYDGIIPASVI